MNQENGTYDVVVKVNENVQSGIKQVLVPIWSDAQQKDINMMKGIYINEK